MAIGSSGRVVIELNPETKKRIHDVVRERERERGLTLREWFLQQAEQDLLIVGGARGSKSATNTQKRIP
jgi:hypothetical protein